MSAHSAKVRYSELLDAIEFVSSGAPFDNSAFVDRETGVIHYLSPEVEAEDEVPEGLENSERYIEVPHKSDLNLGRNLALSFAEKELPGEYESVSAFFRKKGAYARFKELLDRRKLLEHWYAYESSETERALRLWCQENAIALADEPPVA